MRRTKKRGTGIGIISFVVLILFGIVAYRRIDLEEQSKEAKLAVQRLETQIQEQDERTTEINNRKAYVQTKQYIEDMAREKLGLVFEDDILFKEEEKE